MNFARARRPRPQVNGQRERARRLWAFTFRRGRHGSAGFTLTEVMVAIGILVVGMLGIIALISVGVTSHRRAIRATDATFIATSEIAELRQQLDKADRSAKDVTMVGYQRHELYPRYWYRVEAVELDKDGREVFVRVTVRWSKDGASGEVFETIVLRRR